MLHGTNPLLTLAIVLLAGSVFGNLTGRLRLPAVTGQIVVGLLLGPSLLGLFSLETLDGLLPITHFALGLIAVAVGSHLNIRRLRNATKRLLILVALEATITPAFVFLGMLFVPDMHWSLGLLLGMLAISTAPATIFSIVKESRSKGVFVKTLMAAVALNNIACILLFELAYRAARNFMEPSLNCGLLRVFSAPLYQLVFSAALGVGAGLLLILATRKIVRSDRLATASIIAILVTAGLADYLGVSLLLSCLFLGVAVENLTPEKDEIGHGVFANLEGAILTVFFTLAGMELDLRVALAGGVIAILVVVLRLAGKIVAAWLAMRLAGAPSRIRRTLGPALIPQAGVAVGLILMVQADPQFGEIANLILAVGLTSVLLNEIIGPIFTRMALVRSGDYGMDKARLIDFLHEENIVTGFRADSKEEAIRELTDILIRTNHLNVDRKELLASILQREEQISTCIGAGLAIPHGELENGDSMIGAMAISREGMDIPTPDGIPLHCIVLLATPPNQRDRHLAVLAALARALGSDPNIRHQLFNAKSAAHAYYILQAQEMSNYNYWLESTSA